MFFLHKDRKQNISEKDGEYWMLTKYKCFHCIIIT